MSLWGLNFQQLLAIALLLVLLWRYTGMMICLAVITPGASVWRFYYSEPTPAMLVLLMVGGALGMLCFCVERYRTARAPSRFPR